MADLVFQEQAWEDFLYWQKQDPKTLKRILLLIKDIDRNGVFGIGKPEALADDLAGWWSVRIDGFNRLIFKIENGKVVIYACKGHYRDK